MMQYNDIGGFFALEKKLIYFRLVNLRGKKVIT